MKVVTRQGLAKSAAARWYGQYEAEIKYGSAKPSMGRNGCAEIYNSLKSLDPVTPDAVDSIIGSNCMTRIDCSECDNEVAGAVEFETSEWPIFVCYNCLIESLHKLAMEAN